VAYPNTLSTELTSFSLSRTIELEQVDKQVTTPFAIFVPLIKLPTSTIYYGDKYPVAQALKAGWRLLAWDWSSHGKRDDLTNYLIAYMGKAFDKPALATFTPAYTNYNFSTGCSDNSCNTFAKLKTLAVQSSPLNYGGGGWLRLYYGPKLTPEQKAEAKGLGWRGVRGTSLMVLGKTAKELPEEVKKELGL
jgi:hypothetical protein